MPGSDRDGLAPFSARYSQSCLTEEYENFQHSPFGKIQRDWTSAKRQPTARTRAVSTKQRPLRIWMRSSNLATQAPEPEHENVALPPRQILLRESARPREDCRSHLRLSDGSSLEMKTSRYPMHGEPKSGAAGSERVRGAEGRYPWRALNREPRQKEAARTLQRRYAD
jgi:hypothetical protein